MKHLSAEGWTIEDFCLGQTRGCDIVAVRNGVKMLVEVKGARASDDSPTKKRAYFDSGQIKTHFGKAIVKIMDDKHANPDAHFAIAHPNDVLIRNAIGHLTPALKALDIKHYWVSNDGTVTQD